MGKYLGKTENSNCNFQSHLPFYVNKRFGIEQLHFFIFIRDVAKHAIALVKNLVSYPFLKIIFQTQHRKVIHLYLTIILSLKGYFLILNTVCHWLVVSDVKTGATLLGKYSAAGTI